MKLAILSDTRVPTLPIGGHGLGRVACDIASGLAKRGHDVTLYAGKDSIAPDGVALVTHDDEITRVDALNPADAEAWLDLSHFHALVRRREFKQAHYIVDDECAHEPVCAVVGSDFRKRSWPTAEIVPLGIDTAAIPFNAAGGENLLFVAKIERRKGPDIALDVAHKAGRKLHLYGALWYDGEPDGWRGVIDDNAELYRVLGDAYAFLAPYRDDAGGRVLLEAQAAGTPVLTFGDVGCISHVAHCVGGFVCATPEEMAEAVADVPLLDRAKARAWVVANHDLGVMLDGFERVLARVAGGEAW